MSNVVFLCQRFAEHQPDFAKSVAALGRRLTPDNIEMHPARVIESAGISIAVLNPNDTLRVHGTSVCLGVFYDSAERWWCPGTEAPDGSYALLRADEHKVEIVSDMVASRTLWYALTEDRFIASTSQRAIIFFLRKYEANESAYAWQLSAGTLGPGLSWDARIRSLPGESRLILDRAEWKERLVQKEVVFAGEELPDEHHETRLRRAMDETFDGLQLDTSRWILPLSGGYDSRAILQMLRNRSGLKAVTWGVRSALQDKYSDACVAQELAQEYGLEHEYFATDLTDEPVEKIFKRFLVAGEGRVDHISGYMDGFSVWKRLYDSNTLGIIRGDSALGWDTVVSTADARQKLDLMRLQNYGDLAGLSLDKHYQQNLPDEYARGDDESLDTWRDRLYQIYRQPVVIAALNALKSPYVEIINPLLSKRIITQVRTLPDHLRNNRRLFKKIVVSGSVNVPFARHAAIETSGNILRSSGVTEYLRSALQSERAERLLSPELLRWVKSQMDISSRNASKERGAGPWTKGIVKQILPDAVIDTLRTVANPLRRKSPMIAMDPYKLAFRVYIICAMDELLHDDMAYLGR